MSMAGDHFVRFRKVSLPKQTRANADALMATPDQIRGLKANETKRYVSGFFTRLALKPQL